MNIVVLDIGGSSLKVWKPFASDPVRIETGHHFEPQDCIHQTLSCLTNFTPDRISIGFPGLVRWGRVAEEPANLGKGWIGFDFSHAFGRPARLMNDAQMQALGGYEGGRMLYLGFGTGLGTTLITEGGMSQLALGTLPFTKGKSFNDFLSKKGVEEMGLDRWRIAVAEAVPLLKRAMLADYVLLGGGGVEHLNTLPEGCRRGGNEHAYFGGLRMWEDIGLQSPILG